MTYPQQPGNWQDQPQAYWPADPAQQASGAPAGYSGYAAQPPASAVPADYAGYGAAQPTFPAYGYQTPILVAAAPRTNGMAIAALVVSLSGLVMCGLPSIVGAILGHVARRQIRQRGEGGDGMALAAIITGYIFFGLFLLFALIEGIGIGYAITHDPTYTDPGPYAT